MSTRNLLAAVCTIGATFGIATEAGSQPIALDAAHLERHGVVAEAVTHEGRPAVKMTTATGTGDDKGIAVVEDTDFDNGTIEIDVAGEPGPNAPAGARGFIGLAFRVQDERSQSSPGASGMLYLDPKEHLGVVFLSNLEDAPARLETARALARIVAEKSPPPITPAAAGK